MIKITKFEIVKGITNVRVFSVVMLGLSKYKDTQEELEKYLSEEIKEDELRRLKSVAQQENYPLSFDGLQ